MESGVGILVLARGPEATLRPASEVRKLPKNSGVITRFRPVPGYSFALERLWMTKVRCLDSDFLG